MDAFERSPDEDLPAFSRNDKTFLTQMQLSTCITPSGSIQLPLPVKHDHKDLPDNKSAVYCRTENTLDQLANDKNRSKLEFISSYGQKFRK